MKSAFALVAVLAIATGPAVLAQNLTDDSVEIPLKDIWAYRMPGTRDINAESNDARSQVEDLLTKIHDSWRHDRGVEVQGEGLQALEDLRQKRIEKRPRKDVKGDSPISIAFFTRRSGFYVHVQKVERQGNRITIRYHFVPHQTDESTQHLALIPLGKLPGGKYVVNIERTSMERKYVELGFPEPPKERENDVCGSFEFFVFVPVNRKIAK